MNRTRQQKLKSLVESGECGELQKLLVGHKLELNKNNGGDYFNSNRYLNLEHFYDTSDDKRITVLMIAARDGNLDCVRALLNAGVNPNTQDTSNRMWRISAAPRRLGRPETALAYAVYNGHLDCVRLLLEKGANPFQDVDDPNEYGNAVEFAIERKCIGCLNMIYDSLLAQGDNRAHTYRTDYDPNQTLGEIIERLRRRRANRMAQFRMPGPSPGTTINSRVVTAQQPSLMGRIMGFLGHRGMNSNNISRTQNTHHRAPGDGRGGSKFINIPKIGRRKVRYYKNGKPYVLIKGKKIKI